MAVLKDIRKTIDESRCGSLFFNNSFPEYDDEYVRHILSDLCKQDVIVRIAFGVYLKPLQSKFGIVYPPVDEIVSAIAKRDNADILPTGNTAMNKLGLSTQVPMNSEYITSGSARKMKIGKRIIHLKRTIRLKRSIPKNFAYKGELMPILVQAMKAIGKDNLTEEHRGVIRKLLKEHPEVNTWKKDLQLAPLWIRKVLSTLKNEIDNEQMD